MSRTLSTKHFFFIMMGFVGLLSILSIAGVVVGNNMLAKKTKRLTELKLDNRVLDEQKISVIQAQKDIEKYAELEKIAKSIVPQDKDQAKAVREIVKFAQESNINITAISFPSSTLGQAQAAPAAPAEGEAAAPKPATPPLSQVKPVEGIPNVFLMEITVQSGTDAATFPKLIDFLKKLESNRRTSQVSNTTITPNAADRSLLSFSMTINVYIKP